MDTSILDEIIEEAKNNNLVMEQKLNVLDAIRLTLSSIADKLKKYSGDPDKKKSLNTLLRLETIFADMRELCKECVVKLKKDEDLTLDKDTQKTARHWMKMIENVKDKCREIDILIEEDLN